MSVANYDSVNHVDSDVGLERPSRMDQATGARKRGYTSSLSASAMYGEQSLWTLLTTQQLWMIVGVVLTLFLGISYAAFYDSRTMNQCLPAPYLYVSYGTDHNIFQITRDGCIMMNKVLYGVPRKKLELRSLATGDYRGEAALYVADAARKTENILVFGDCSNWGKMRSKKARVMGTGSVFEEGAQHAYGISFDSKENLYVSYQHTNAILRSSKDDFRVMELPQAMKDRESKEGIKLFQGTFFQFGAPEVHKSSDQGVRSIAWADHDGDLGELLWVANEFENKVYILDHDASVVKMLDVTAPIGMFHERGGEGIYVKNRIYIGSRNGKKTGSVLCYDTNTFELLGTYFMLGMSHPTGIAVYENVLYVADQSLNSILTFDLETGRFISTIWSRDVGNIEQLVLTSC